jgi:hypothetical protein
MMEIRNFNHYTPTDFFIIYYLFLSNTLQFILVKYLVLFTFYSEKYFLIFI